MSSKGEILILQKAVELLKSSTVYLKSSDVNIVNSLVEAYELEINEYTSNTRDIVNATKKEVGLVNSAIKKRIKSFYLSPLKKEYNLMEDVDYKIHDLIRDLDEDFMDKCNKTSFSIDLFNAKLLLNRRVGNWYYPSKLESATNDLLLTSLLQEFQEQNKQFINQKIKNYETSKC